jgi:hypothetical protein
MIPRTVQAAAAIQSTFTTNQYNDYGNIILNGYQTTASAVSTAGAIGAVNTVTISAAGTNYTNGTYTNVYLGGYPEGSWATATVIVAGGIVTTVTVTGGGQNYTVGQVITLGGIPRTAPGTAATVTVATVNTNSYRPAIKGWTTNYSSYYTEIPPNPAPYDATYPGMDAGGFEYIVHSFKPPTGVIAGIGAPNFTGTGYTDGVYTNVSTTTSSFGTGATLNIVVSGGQVVQALLNNPGSGYPRNAALYPNPATIGAGTGFYAIVLGITNVSANGDPYWSQRPVNGQAAVNSLFPLSGVGGWIYPVADSPVAPPIDAL